ncbi:hypothetical protein PT974_01629 [Cladobotryum mycophilum]|uniref:SRR1-like domain-containing protein n=1 Tax=Cladobotryum mycophilum TaxID=491253 RepID=A0ABR0T4A6_9HYPO
MATLQALHLPPQHHSHQRFPPAPVTRAICLGIGSFDPPDGGWEAKRKTYIQLIAFLIMVEELEKSLATKIPCIFQEPIFTEHDRTFLTNLGHQIVDSPRGCELVDKGTFFYGVHLYRPIYVMALKNTTPAIFVGTGWDVWDQVNISSEPSDDLFNLHEIELTYNKAPFPQDTTTAFSSTSIYFRPPATTQEKDGEQAKENLQEGLAATVDGEQKDKSPSTE